MELTLRTRVKYAVHASCEVAGSRDDRGDGTILFPHQVSEVIEAGAEFGVAPGLNPVVIRCATGRRLPFAPGVVTPSDIDAAVQCGCRELKFFPAEPSGGLQMLASIKAPYAHLGLKYIPLGGVTLGNLKSYLSDPDVLAVGGSWLAKKDAIDSERWDEIASNALHVRDIAAVVCSSL